MALNNLHDQLNSNLRIASRRTSLPCMAECKSHSDWPLCINKINYQQPCNYRVVLRECQAYVHTSAIHMWTHCVSRFLNVNCLHYRWIYSIFHWHRANILSNSCLQAEERNRICNLGQLRYINKFVEFGILAVLMFWSKYQYQQEDEWFPTFLGGKSGWGIHSSFCVVVNPLMCLWHCSDCGCDPWCSGIRRHVPDSVWSSKD